MRSPVRLGTRRRSLLIGAAAAPMLASVLVSGLATGAGAATTGPAGAPVRAVVAVQPGVTLPVAVPGGRVVTTLPHVGAEVVLAPASSLARLATDPRVAGVSADRSGTVSGKSYGAGKPGGKDDAGVYAADWLGGDAGKAGTGQGVNVALLDTGVSDTPALDRASGRITDGVDVTPLAHGGDPRTEGQFTDSYGHGTFLADLIAGGRPSPSAPALGVAPAARVVVVKVADASGETSLVQVLAGMDWVASHAQGPDGQQMIQVLNLALAMDRPTAPSYGADPLTVAVDHVRAAGVLVVAAAGNTPGEVGDPGLDPHAFTVGAADLTRPAAKVAPFSGSGVVAGVAKPDVVASGVRLLSLLPADSTIAEQNPSGWQPSGLFRGSGTSEATAVASGVAAAWFSDHPQASPEQAKVALRSSTEHVPGNGTRSGAGLLTMDGQAQHGKAARSAGDGEDGFDAQAWQDDAWNVDAWDGTGWQDWLASSWSASSWSASSWSASSWSASSWSASSWSASSWSASSWSASSWSASSWSASSWSASSWSASSWSDFGWGDDA